ncbi:MAG: AAA family ATPase [Thermoplasmatales archaeon]|nr:AAA family ATPase [Thermoplasmatales archaeon]
MRIRRIHIKSFGNMTNWHSGDLGDGVTIVYGDNEAGKTTITEFVRGTLFPSRGQKYPAYEKTDSGTIVVEMDDGERRVYERKGRRTTEQGGKPLPGEESNLDADTYSSLYAMGLEQLTNAKLISGGEFRSRFLTVPGGENIPAVSEDIRNGMLDLMNRERLTSNKGIGKSLAEIRAAEEGIASAKADDDAFDGLFAERARLEGKAEELRRRDALSRDEGMRRGIIDSQAGNLERLDALGVEIEILSTLEVSGGDVARHQSLKTKAEGAMERLAVAEGKVPPPELEGRTAEEVLALADDIEAAWQSKSRVEVLEHRLADIEGEIEAANRTIAGNASAMGWTEEAARAADSGREVVWRAEREDAGRTPRGRGPVPAAALAFGAVLSVLGVAALLGLAPAPPLAGIVFSIAGAVSIILGAFFLRAPPADGDWNSWITSKGYPNGTTPRQVLLIAPKLREMRECAARRDNLAEEAEGIAADMATAMSPSKRPAAALGLGGLPFGEAVGRMYSLLNAARRYSGETNLPYLKKEAAAAVDELDGFLVARGGAERFAEALGATARLAEARKEATALESSIVSSSGIPVAELRELVSNDGGERHAEAETSSELDAVNKSIGELTAKLDAILDDGDLNAARARKAAAEAKLLTESRKWAVLSLADHLISSATSHFYKDLQPDVVKLANVYLGAMTGGRYSLDSDPRETELCIWDGYTKKYPSQWSSGLGDQVYLSVKMAIAGSMTRESMPMILDDVLVRFDKGRKQGAAKAILEYAKGRQVIILTCDRQLYPLFALEGKASLVELS